MRKISLSVTLFVMVLSAFSQSVLDKIPPSPTVASIIGAGEITTSKFTGTPNISIPLYQVGFHNMGVPISLSYNAQGIRVNDVPGWVGTNWSLSAGGVITRTINGQPDDAPSSGYFALQPVYENSGGLSQRSQLEGYDSGDSDGHPDIYSFSFPGGSGKFIIDHNKEIQVFPHQKIDVQFISPSKVIGDGFTIRTLDGTLYTFDEIETTKIPSSGNLSSITYTSSFYLKTIENPIFPGKQITFSYSSFINLTDVRKLRSYSAARRYYTGSHQNNLGTQISDRLVSYKVKRLDSINWDTGSVEFVADTARVDLLGEKRLDEVKIKDDQGALIKKYVLNYDHYTLAPGSVSASGKLRLRKVHEYGNDGISNPPHVFNYESDLLPDYNDKGQDFWGYYNGKSGNSDLLPKQIVDYDLTEGNGLLSLSLSDIAKLSTNYNIGSADRDPDEAYLRKGILQSITYPTGGSTHFDYEINEYGNVQNDNIENASDRVHGNVGSLPNYGTGFANNYDYLLNTFGRQVLDKGQASIWSYAGLSANTETITFTLPQTQKVNFSFTLTSILGLSSYVKVERNSAGTWELVYDSQSILVAIPGDQNDPFNPPILFSNRKLLKKEMLAGQYRMTTYVQATTPVNGYFPIEEERTQINASWYVPTGNENLHGPGLRIRQISQMESVISEAVNIRRFEYNDESNKSSGMLYAMPVHSYRKFTLEIEEIGRYANGDPIYGEFLVPLIIQSSGSSYNVSSQPLGYGRVTEYIGINGENGKIVDEYRVDHEDAFVSTSVVANASLRHPFAPAYFTEWDAGQLLKSTVYRKKNLNDTGSEEYRKVQETENTYTFQKGAEVKGVAVALILIDNQGSNLADHFYTEQPYAYTSLWQKLIKTEQTVFTPWETGQTTVTDLTYESTPGHLQVKSQSVTSSDGRKTISEYTYPADYSISNPHPYAADLLNINMHGAVIEELNLLEYNGIRQILGGKMTKYDSTAFQPEEIFTLKAGPGELLESSLHKSTSYNGSNSLMDSLYESRITFGYRDGNLIEQLPTSGTLVTYVWGYGNQYPVAKVLNASYADVENLLSPSQTIDLDLGFDGLTTTQANDLRNNLPGALATTQTYQFGYGMKTQTDPNGLTTKYFYDAFGRLKLIKDPDDNIIQTFKYNYKGQ